MEDPVESPHDWYIDGLNILVRNHAALPKVNLDTGDDDAELIEVPMRLFGGMPFWAQLIYFTLLPLIFAPRIGLSLFVEIALMVLLPLSLILLRRLFPKSPREPKSINIRLYRDKTAVLRDRRRIRIAIGMFVVGIATFFLGIGLGISQANIRLETLSIILLTGIFIMFAAVVILWGIQGRLCLRYGLGIPSGWARLKNVHPDGFAKMLDLERQRASTP
ncbi:hypothetical protein JIN85_02515 [Luteolibacter pohnpeiensis]|uniref:Uncharacterized protein n=1 Tax=Luteolibacter pohnpeiensis TaxID=454153 RepID=A0A934VV81_9BACT|nr:hypothetical protein [Luteolibacter pohnpeiensis]MBK1881269.1 hypothetical protein [Luteolibacter pohnpeiensis]